MLLFIGIPCFFLEITIGQYAAMGPVTIYSNLSPLFKGNKIFYCLLPAYNLAKRILLNWGRRDAIGVLLDRGRRDAVGVLLDLGHLEAIGILVDLGHWGGIGVLLDRGRWGAIGILLNWGAVRRNRGSVV